VPFKSEKQRRFMYSQHPEIAQRWADEGKGYVMPGKMKYGIKPKGTVANNRPVGSAGQPNGGLGKHESKDDSRFSAISRRIDKMNKDRGKTNGTTKGSSKGGY
jgi:hypothetical protein